MKKDSVLIAPEDVVDILAQNVMKEHIDSNTCIIMSNAFISYHKKWVLVSTKLNSDLFSLRLCVCSPHVDQDTMILSSCNLFNLHSTPHKVYTPLICDLIISNLECETFTPHVALSVVLTRRFILNVNDSVVEKELLLNYFSRSRYMCIGDVFLINTQNFGGRYLSHDLPDLIYYNVENITGPQYENEIVGMSYCYMVSSVSTKLQIDRTGNFFLPPVDYMYVNNGQNPSRSIMNNIMCKVPSGLELYFEKMKKLVLPFLLTETSDVNMTPAFLLTGKRGSGKTTLLLSLAEHYGLKYVYENCVLLQTDNPVTTESNINNIFQKLLKNAPCLLHFRHIEALCTDDTGNLDCRIVDNFLEKLKDVEAAHPFVIFCTTNEKEKLAKPLHRSFLQVLEISPLDSDQRISILRWILSSEGLEVTEPLNNIIPLTSSFVFTDFIQLVSRAVKIQLKNSSDFKFVKNNSDLDWRLIWRSRSEDYALQISTAEIKEALEEMNANYSKSIGAPKMQNVTWDDIGGLGKLKDEILSAFSTTNLPDGLQRSGLLLHGPPGTGKTLLAKAVATHFKYNFLSVKGPELLNMWVGQSEENVRQVFAVARASSPCIIFFDELDSLAPKRGEAGGGGGVMDRVVSQLLAEMDGIQKKKGVFILAATNRSDLIDSALLRPGRLDKMLFVGGYNDVETRLSIVKALTRKFEFKDDVDLSNLLKLLPSDKNVTGADFYGICSKAWLNAARRHIRDSDGDKQKLKSKVLVSKMDMIDAFKAFSGAADEETNSPDDRLLTS